MWSEMKTMLRYEQNLERFEPMITFLGSHVLPTAQRRSLLYLFLSATFYNLTVKTNGYR